MNLEALLADTADLAAAVARAIAPSNPPPALQWTEENFRLSAKDSAAPGLVSLDPWQREVIQAWNDPKTSRVIVAASSQVGKTLIGLALMNYTALCRPGPMLYVTESDTTAEAFAKDRIRPSIDENPTAACLVGRRFGAGQTTTRLEFTTGSTLNIVGAQAPSGLSSRPVMTLFATEVRGFPITAGQDGDPLTLALARLKSFGSRAKAFIESSPGIVDHCRLTQEAAKGDKRRYFLPCPHCGHAAPVTFDPEEGCHQVGYAPQDPDAAAIRCEACKTHWTEAERLQAIQRGSFRPTQEPTEPGVVSFHYSELESPRSRVASIVRRYLAARADPKQLQGFTNTTLGLPFDRSAHETRFDPSDLSARAENYDARVELPHQNCLAITAGVDTQDDRLEAQIVGHGPEGEMWSLGYYVIRGDPGGATLWRQLTELLRDTTYRHPFGPLLEIRAACIDSGGSFTANVYSYSAEQQQQGRPVFAIKGLPNVGMNKREIVARSTTTKLSPDSPFRLLQVGVDTAKSQLFANLKRDAHGPGYIHFPTAYPEAFYRGLTSERERLKIDKKGVVTTEFYRHDYKVGNEPLDTLIYAIAAYHTIHPEPDFDYIRAVLIQKANKSSQNTPNTSVTETTGARLQRALNQRQ